MKKRKPRLASMQPQIGDTVIYCKHACRREDNRLVFEAGTHWFRADTWFVTPSGERGDAKWIMCCNSCYRSVGGDMKKLNSLPIGGHMVLSGSPEIGENLS